MNFDSDHWMKRFTDVVKQTFEGRVCCIGLQGSRGRGEARPDSDIDVVVILDRLDPEDLKRYRAAVAELPGRALLCGFVSGREELLHWEPSELFQFYHDTVPVEGDLEFLLPVIRQEDVIRSVKIGAGNLYHACVHNYLHERDGGLLASLYKSAVFTVQAKYYVETGAYIQRHGDLLAKLSGAEREIVETALAVCGGACLEVERDSARLFQWAGALLRREA